MDCPICCESITELTGHCKLACKHTFHINCVSTWCNDPRQTCPLCRRFLSKDERFWKWNTETQSLKRDPLKNPPEEQRIMWDAMRLFDDSSEWTYQGPNPDIDMRKNWRSRRNYYMRKKWRLRRNRYDHPFVSRGIHTHTDFITDTTYPAHYDSD